MRRYDSEWAPRTLPSGIPLVCSDRVLFNVADHYLYVPGFLLFNGVSIFKSFLHTLNSFDMKATIDTVNQTATSTKVFDIVFQPLLYGYLDLEEIDDKSTVRHNTIAVLADGLVLANKIEATSVIALIQGQLHDKYASTSLSVPALKKLFGARPMTTDFLANYMSRLSSIPRDSEILQSLRDQVEGFAHFERACHEKLTGARAVTEESVRVPTIDQEVDIGNNKGQPKQTPRVEVEVTVPSVDKQVDMDPNDERPEQGQPVEMQVDVEEKSTVKQGKRPLRDLSPAFPASKRHKENDAVSDTTAVPSAPRLAPAADNTIGLTTPSAQILKDLSAAAPPPLSTFARVSSAAAAPKAAKPKAKFSAKTASATRTAIKARGKKQAALADEATSGITSSNPVATPAFAQGLLCASEVAAGSDDGAPTHQARKSDFLQGNKSSESAAAIVSTTASPMAENVRLSNPAITPAPEATILRANTKKTAVSKSTAKAKEEARSKTTQATSSTNPKAETQAKATKKARTREASKPAPVLVSKTAIPPNSDPEPKAVAKAKAGTKSKLTLKLGSAAEPEPAMEAEPEPEQQPAVRPEPTTVPESVPKGKAKATTKANDKTLAPAPEPFTKPAPSKLPGKSAAVPPRPATRSRKTTTAVAELSTNENDVSLTEEASPANPVMTNAKTDARHGKKKAVPLATLPPSLLQPAVIVPSTANRDASKATSLDLNAARGAIHSAIIKKAALVAIQQSHIKNTNEATEIQKDTVKGTAKVIAKAAPTATAKSTAQATPKATPRAAVNLKAAAKAATTAAKGKSKGNATATAAIGDHEDEGGEGEGGRPRRAAATKVGK